MSEVDEANEILRSKGYKEAHLGVFSTPMPSKLLIKGTRIVSPFADSPETVLRAVRDCVPTSDPTSDDLGRRTITPHELRACLERS
jgi:hypothetical protein